MPLYPFFNLAQMDPDSFLPPVGEFFDESGETVQVCPLEGDEYLNLAATTANNSGMVSASYPSPYAESPPTEIFETQLSDCSNSLASFNNRGYEEGWFDNAEPWTDRGGEFDAGISMPTTNLNAQHLDTGQYPSNETSYEINHGYSMTSTTLESALSTPSTFIGPSNFV